MRRLWISLIAGTALSAGEAAFAGGLPGSNNASTASAAPTETASNGSTTQTTSSGVDNGNVETGATTRLSLSQPLVNKQNPGPCRGC